MNKLKFFLPLLAGFVLLTLPVPVIAETKQLTAEKDTSVNSSYPETNFGSEKKLSIGFTNSSYIIFIKFRLEGLSKESFREDEKAILNLWLEESAGEVKTIETEVLLPSNDWNEEELTWNNKPSLYSSEISADLEATPGAQQIDITELVKQWLTEETKNTGIALYYNWEVFSRTYSSRENEKHPPTLVIGKETQAEAFPVTGIKEKDGKISVVEAVKTKIDRVRGVKVKKSLLNFNSLVSTNSIIPGIMIWVSCVFLLLVNIAKHFD